MGLHTSVTARAVKDRHGFGSEMLLWNIFGFYLQIIELSDLSPLDHGCDY